MINREYYTTRRDGVKIYRIYSDLTPTILQEQKNEVYDCWVYDEEGKPDFEKSGIYDVENAPYTYQEIFDYKREEIEIIEEN